MRRGAIIAGLAAVIGLALAAGYLASRYLGPAGGQVPAAPASAPASPAATPAAVPDTRPEFSLVDANGVRRSISEWDGRPLLINFWATWCPPCIKELPDLDRFAAAHGQRVQVVGLAIDNLAAVQAFLARQPLRFDIGLAGMAGTELGRTLGNQAGVLPFTVLLDAKGAVLRRKVGQSHYEELENWLKLL